MKKVTDIHWSTEPSEPDYLAALSYLCLIYHEDTVTKIIKKIRRAPIVGFKGKDIFRAAHLALLDVNNSHVEKDRKEIIAGNKISPLLLVRDSNNGKLIIADGYYRLCAVYAFDENANIPCKII